MKVEIWSDVVCPWCYIGKRRFEAALGRFEHADQVEVEWRSFELDPHATSVRAPGEGPDHADILASKYAMSRARPRRRSATSPRPRPARVSTSTSTSRCAPTPSTRTA